MTSIFVLSVEDGYVDLAFFTSREMAEKALSYILVIKGYRQGEIKEILVNTFDPSWTSEGQYPPTFEQWLAAKSKNAEST